MTIDDCGHHDCDCDCQINHPSLRRCMIYTLIILIIILGLTILISWLIIHPTKPEFILQDATVSSFILTTQSNNNTLTSSFQVTILTKNPNGVLGINYERAHIYASYRNQLITIPIILLPTYLGHKDIVLWSPYLGGDSVPINTGLGMLLQQDLNAGIVKINVKIDGIIKWKVGSWVSGKYQMNVNCHAYVIFGEKNYMGNNGGGNNYNVVYDPSDNYRLSTKCDVDV